MELVKAKRAYAIVCALSLLCNIATADAINQAGWRAHVIELAKGNFKHPAWGYSHSVRDYNLAKTLAGQDGVKLDDDVLFASAYLHDMAMFPGWEKDGVDHADQAAAIVDTVLNGSGFPEEKIEMVRRAIRSHMFNRDPEGAESVYLHDADALDWLGAIGIIRIFSMIEPNGGQPDSHKVVMLFENYMKDVPNHVISPAGKMLAAERNAEAMNYLKRLNAETANLNSL